jgi:hypothetical protein
MQAQSEGARFSQKNMRRTWLMPLVALAIVAYFAIIQLANWPERLRYPGEEDAVEGTQLSEMVHLRRGVHIYRLPSNGEFDGAIYGPLCYLLGAATINQNQPAYGPLRIISFVATLSLAAACGLLTFTLTRRKIAGVLAAWLLFATAFIGRYGISARADMVGLLLAFTGFLVFYRCRDSKRALILSALLVLLSFFYKQQFLGAPGAILTYLVLDKRYRQAFDFLFTLIAGGVILVGLFSFLIFPHQAFLQHFIAYNRLPFDKQMLLPEILMFAIPLFIPLVGSIDFLTQYPDKLVACYVGVSVGSYFLLLFSSGSGADTNRCLEPLVILTCVFAARVATSDGILPGLGWVAPLAATLALVSFLGFAFVVPRVGSTDFAADAAMQSYLREHFAPRTSALGYYAGDPIRAGLDAPITNLWGYTALIRKGTLSDREIVSRIENGGYGVILLDFDLDRFNSSKMGDFYTTRPMRDAVLHSYQEVARLSLPRPETSRFTDGSMYVWVPRSPVGVRHDANTIRGQN